MSAYETTKHSKPKLLSIKISGKKKTVGKFPRFFAIYL